ncbi:tetratricopeptide repeat-containing sulfotransferase family protein [Halioxenophilus sp. WMMB6]|uniref:tetratricopeptide repeat-containing sulfotransferase family protein n=1 Tax=Halioxenophilus sp. WMMB6 TaxID=3073815 RepID=UPI00295E3F20|nr:sulfotransferase [Halioxenophilus sp. WMMB6]
MDDQGRQAIETLMRERQFNEALAELEAGLAVAANDPDLYYFKAVCLRYLQRLPEALSVLQQLKQVAAGFGRAFQEEGHCLRTLGDLPTALKAYRLATENNIALLASWKARAEIAGQLDLVDEARLAAQQLQRLAGEPKAIVAILDLMAEGRWLKAENLCRKFLVSNPQQVRAMRLLAEIGVRMGALDEAEFLLESALVFEPGNADTQLEYVQVLRKRQKFSQALAVAKALWQTNPAHPQLTSVYAIECMQTGDYAGAVNLFDTALQTLGEEPVTLTSRGHALKTWGKTDQAIASYRRALAAKPGHGEAWYALANLKTVAFEQADIEQMNNCLTRADLSQMDRIYLQFALGKAYEDNADYAHSFQHYSAGNAAKKSQSRYRAEQMSEEFKLQRQVVTPALITQLGDCGFPAADPIFIVGLPRAGSTLLEQILASHSQVDGTLELPNVLSLVHRLRRGTRFSGENNYPQVLAELTPEQCREFGEQYIRETQIHRQRAPFFIDKMPNNFRHIGLIKMMLPNAKIIDARREPMACCFSGFKQLFAEGQEFSYSLGDIGHYYCDYLALMDYWQGLFPGQILLVNYESVVADFEKQVRRLLDYCGLDFEQGCLDFYQNKRAVRTASSEQVRQPIYQSGLEQWRHYQEYLQPLADALRKSHNLA